MIVTCYSNKNGVQTPKDRRTDHLEKFKVCGQVVRLTILVSYARERGSTPWTATNRKVMIIKSVSKIINVNLLDYSFSNFDCVHQITS